MTRIIHQPVDGQHLAAVKALRLSRAERILLASLAAALICATLGLTLRALAMAEQLAQIARV